MSLLYTASFKEFGSVVYLCHDVKLRKTQLEVRSLNVTWRRDLWCHWVIIFWKCFKLFAKQLWEIWLRYAPPFFRYLRKTWLGGGGADNRPPAVRGLTCSWKRRFCERISSKCFCVSVFGIGWFENESAGDEQFALLVNVICSVFVALNVFAHFFAVRTYVFQILL